MSASPKTQIDKLISLPSISAMTYQVSGMISELERINDTEYPPQALQIRDVLQSIAEYVQSELWTILKQHKGKSSAADSVLLRARELSRVIHQLYPYLRYLRASLPLQSPPGLQLALVQLTDAHFPKKNGKPVCLVRPQWKYNLTYVPLTHYLREIVSPSVLDPSGTLGAQTPDEFLERVWQKWADAKNKGPFPKQLAVLSFAGLDTSDCLLYVLLAHELGHFIDYSFDEPLHLKASVRKASKIDEDEVRAILESGTTSAVDGLELSNRHNDLVQRTFICLREVLADLLAVRMMGFGFFVAQAEFLKTLLRWPGRIVESSGYPGIRFRLSVMLEQLLEERYHGNINSFLRENRKAAPATADALIRFIDGWRRRLNVSTPYSAATSVEERLWRLLEKAVTSSLTSLKRVARDTIPDKNCSCLSLRFFDRIKQLQQKLPPSLDCEEQSSFGEIMAASWAYQMLSGEEIENNQDNLGERIEEYDETCRLVSKAIELIPHAAASRGFERQRRSMKRSVRSGVLDRDSIVARISFDVDDERYLAIIPTHPASVQAASLDLRLGNWFVSSRRTRLRSVQLGSVPQEQLLATLGREEAFVAHGKTFLIHPGDLVLGVTLEFVGLPNDVMAFVEGRSRLGRAGLIVATATQVAPGFHGVIVLELANAGTVPLELGPGMPVAQLVLQQLSNPVARDNLYRGRFYCQIKP